jgi:hypothetical protein
MVVLRGFRAHINGNAAADDDDCIQFMLRLELNRYRAPYHTRCPARGSSTLISIPIDIELRAIPDAQLSIEQLLS